MKKKLLAIGFGLIGTATICSHTMGQTSKRTHFSDYKLPDSTIRSTTDRTAGESATINTRAVRNFGKFYKDADAVKWEPIQDGFVANCQIEGRESKVFYDSKGKFCGSLTYYDDASMPRDLRHLVRSIYYDYKITKVEKVEKYEIVIYFIHIEDESSYKTLRYFNDELEVTASCNKQ